MLYAWQHGEGHTVNGFTLLLQGATESETLRDVLSFVAEDNSGSFGLMKGHAHFITTLVFGLARIRFVDGRNEYLALPGAVAHFANDQLTLSGRRYLRSDDYQEISQALRQELIEEELALVSFKQSLEQMEQAMMLRLWRIGRGEGGKS